MKVADGVMTTPYLMMSDDKVLMAKDAFVRITDHTQDATLNYLVNNAVVRPTELKDADIKAMADFMKSTKADPNILVKGMTIDAWASPRARSARTRTLPVTVRRAPRHGRRRIVACEER